MQSQDPNPLFGHINILKLLPTVGIQTENSLTYPEPNKDGAVDLSLVNTEQWPQLKQNLQPLSKTQDSFLKFINFL